MKANELMIGDWVFNKNTNKPLRVYPTMLSQMFRRNMEDKTEDYGIFPITLTPEILEKNGFHWGLTASEEDYCGAVGCAYPDSGWCFDEGAGEIKIFFPDETDGGLVRLDDQNCNRFLEIVFVEPLMVHEFQRALRCVGLYELANSIKL